MNRINQKFKSAPLHGALAFVGKDNNGRRMLLPVHNLMRAEALINAKSGNKDRLRKVFSTVMNKIVYLFSKNNYKKVREKQYAYLNVKGCRLATNSYLEAVKEKLQPLLDARQFSKG